MPLISFNPIMTIKKAIIIGTLCALGVSLTAYAIKQGIDVTKTITAVNADDLNPRKNQITTDALTNGWQYEVEPLSLNPNQSTFWTNPETITETKPTTLTNTTWTFAEVINMNSLNLEIGQTLTYEINFKAPNRSTTKIYNKIKFSRAQNGTTYELNYQDSTNYSTTVWTNWNNQYWNNENYKTIEIIDGNDTSTQSLIDIIFYNQNENPTFLANKRHETYTSSYLGIEYIMMSQKTYTSGKVKNETLFFIKLQSTGITRQLYLEHAVFYTAIPNMEYNNTYATYNAQFKMAKMSSMNIAESTTLYQQKGSFLNKYNSIQNKTNIYSVDAYVSGTTMNQQQNITYSNEIGTTGTATFGHATSTTYSNAMWTISQETADLDIYTQGRANYLVIYYNCEVSNFQPVTQEQHPGWYQYLYQYVGGTSQFDGYGVSSNPVTPPDIEDGNFMSLTGFILNILTLPFTFLSQAFDLTLWANTPWAFNIKNAIFVMIGIMTFLFIIKLFTRGFDSLGNFSDGWQRHKLTKEQRKTAKLNRQKAEKKVNKDNK